MNRGLILLSIFCLISFYSTAQNLIPNSGFEQPEVCPSKHSMFNYAKPWFTPTFGTTDWFCACRNTRDMNVWVPENFAGYQEACEGRCYAGTFGFFENDALYGEYLEVELLSPLKKGELYYITFYYSLSNLSDYGSQTIGIWLNKKKYFRPKQAERISETPSLINQSPLSTDTLQWHLFAETYRAKGGERYIMIGIPKTTGLLKLDIDRKENRSKKEDRYLLQPPGSCYYYLDDFYLGLFDPKKDSVCGRTPEITGEAIQSDPENHIEENTPIAFRNLHFETDRSEILPASFPELNQLANYLLKHPEINIRIIGHTDSDGEKAHNLELSEKRAKAVALFLENKGIGSDRIKFEGKGDSQPLFPNISPENKEKNRRVEFVLVK